MIFQFFFFALFIHTTRLSSTSAPIELLRDYESQRIEKRKKLHILPVKSERE